MEFLACGDFADLVKDENFIAVLAITLGSVMGIAGIVGGAITGVLNTRAKELTKRELAAYVAEGSLDPDKAVMMLNAGMKRWETPDIGKHL